GGADEGAATRRALLREHRRRARGRGRQQTSRLHVGACLHLPLEPDRPGQMNLSICRLKIVAQPGDQFQIVLQFARCRNAFSSLYFGSDFCRSPAAFCASLPALAAKSDSCFWTWASTSLTACCCSGVNLCCPACFWIWLAAP